MTTPTLTQAQREALERLAPINERPYGVGNYNLFVSACVLCAMELAVCYNAGDWKRAKFRITPEGERVRKEIAGT